MNHLSSPAKLACWLAPNRSGVRLTVGAMQATPALTSVYATTLRGIFVKAQFSPNFEKAGGLITAVTVDAANGDVLMVAYMNPEAFQLTLDTGKVHYWSRTRSKLWKKGESSGNMQELVEMRVDCDLDAVVVRVRQTGPACHEGYRSCFFRTVDEKGELKLNDERIMTPEEIYGAKS